MIISPRATAFTIVCAACAASATRPGLSGASFAGRLDLDLPSGVFLCRNGHAVRVERAAGAPLETPHVSRGS